MSKAAYALELRETKQKLAAAVKAQAGYYAENQALKRKVENLEEQLQELRAAATPFGHMAQEMITGHPTGHLPKGAPERLLAALKAVDRA